MTTMTIRGLDDLTVKALKEKAKKRRFEHQCGVNKTCSGKSGHQK